MQREIKIPPIVAPPPVLPGAAPELGYATPREFTHPPEWTHVEVFTLDEGKRDRYLFVIICLGLLISLLLIGAVSLVKYLMISTLDPVEITIFICTFGCFQTFMIVRLAIRSRRAWPTYRCVVADQGFVVNSLISPRMEVRGGDIRRITETLDTFKVFLAGGSHVKISKRIADDQLPRLRSRLEQLHPIASHGGVLGVVSEIGFSWGLVLGSVSLFYVGIFSVHGRVVLMCAVGTLLITLVRIWRHSRNKSLPLTTRLLILLDLLFPFLLTCKLLVLRFLMR